MSSCFHYLPMNPLPDGVPEYYLVNGLNVEFNLSSVEDDLIALRELAHHNGVELNEFVMYDHSGNMVTYSKQGNSKWITRVQSENQITFSAEKFISLLDEIIDGIDDDDEEMN